MLNAQVEQDPNGMMYAYLYPGYSANKIKKQEEVLCIVDLDDDDNIVGIEVFGSPEWKLNRSPKSSAV